MCMRRSSKKLPTDPNQLAAAIVKLSTEEQTERQPERSPVSAYLAEIGRKGGLKGGKARAKKLSADLRRDIAINAANARWAKTRRPNK